MTNNLTSAVFGAKPVYYHNNTDTDGHPAGGSVTGLGLSIQWQNGPVGEHGPNGAFIEDVIRAAINRIEYHQTMFPCRENAIALTKLEEALLWLVKRTANRVVSGTEGVYVNHPKGFAPPDVDSQ